MVLASTRITLHCLRGLVDAWDRNERMSSLQLTEAHDFNARALSQNLTRLTRAGVLRSSVGGSSRGYQFAKDPRRISLNDILEVLEGKNTHLDCHHVLPQVSNTVSAQKCLLCLALEEVLEFKQNKLKEISIYDYAKHASA